MISNQPLILRLFPLLTFFSRCLSLSHFQVAVQMRRACLVHPCVALCCHGNTLFSHIPAPPFSVLLHPLASDLPAPCRPIDSLFFLLSSLTLAITLLRPRSVLGRPAPRWPTSWGRTWWTELCAPGCDSQQGTVLHEHFLPIHFNLYIWLCAVNFPKAQGHVCLFWDFQNKTEFRRATIFIYTLRTYLYPIFCNNLISPQGSLKLHLICFKVA